MSSDCFDVRVKGIRGTEVIFDVLTGHGGGYDDLCTSRSFALILLADALRRAVDSVPGKWDDPERQATVNRLYEADRGAPITRALAGEDDWSVSEEWMRANVGRFVASCELVERRNDLGDAELARREKAVRDDFGGELFTDEAHLWQPRRWESCHNYTLRVIVTDPKWAAHLEEGLEFGTTAFDVLFE